jgi:hypothetical protein
LVMLPPFSRQQISISKVCCLSSVWFLHCNDPGTSNDKIKHDNNFLSN